MLDIFAGSNTTGAVAEAEGRTWLAFEQRHDYLSASAFRFLPKGTSEDEMRSIYKSVADGEVVNLSMFNNQHLPLVASG